MDQERKVPLQPWLSIGVSLRFDGLTALVLHVRDYRESSALVNFFTREQGRISCVYKGMRRGRRSTVLQALCTGLLSCSGRGGLMNVTRFEELGRIQLQGDHLSGGFYVLELLSRAVPERQPEPALFDAVIGTLQALQQGRSMAPALRHFERQLLHSVGLAVDYGHDYEHGAPIAAEHYYQWVEEHGLRAAAADDQRAIPGAALLAMQAGDFDRPGVAGHARRLHQTVLAPLLGPRPLISRQMLRAATSESADDSGSHA